MIKGNSQKFEGFWAKFDNYEIFKFEDEYYIKPCEESEENIYNLFEISDELLVDFLMIGKEIADNWDHRDIYCDIKSKDKKYQELVLNFVKKYGLLGEITYMPLNDNFISDGKVLLQGEYKKREMELNEYLKMFFEYNTNINFDDELTKENLNYLYGKHGSGVCDYFNRLPEYALTFSEKYSEKVSRILVYAKLMYDTFADMEKYFWEENEEQKEMYKYFLKDFKPFGLAFEINYDEKAILRWNFTSLKQAIETILALNVTNDRKKVKICKRCLKPFIAKNLNSDYCSTSCRNVANVYKSRAKNKEMK